MSISGPLSVVKVGDVTVVVFGSEQRQLDEIGLEKIGRQLVEVAQTASPPLLVLDMAPTEFFGSSFIEALFRVWKKLNTQPGAKFAISGLQPYCKEVLEVTHLDRLWPLPATRAEAVAAFTAK
ncbi:MAG: STAS domain-containing protein [Candidatus Saccharimonas sp.]|nr:STAS domain-containing protein [Planctomycetaceae bacterium]